MPKFSDGIGFEPNQESKQRAEVFVNQFRTFLDTQELALVNQDTPVDDIEDAVDSFRALRTWHEASGEEIPCLAISDDIVAPINILPLSPHYPFPPYRQPLPRWARQAPFELRSSSPEQATNYFFSGMQKFLEWRVAGFLRGWTTLGPQSSSSGASPSPGLACTVTCQSHGMRIHVSPAFFIGWNYFGAPTTPVYGHIRPGLYIFGGDASSSSFCIDSGRFNIPPSLNVQLTAF